MSQVGEDLSAQPALRDALQGETGAIRTNGESGQDAVAGFAPVPGTPWALVTQQNLDTLTGVCRNYGQFLIALLVSLVCVLMLSPSRVDLAYVSVCDINSQDEMMRILWFFFFLMMRPPPNPPRARSPAA